MTIAKRAAIAFAKGVSEDRLVVVLEPELARVFKTPENVKTILEAIARAMPPREPRTVHGQA